MSPFFIVALVCVPLGLAAATTGIACDWFWPAAIGGWMFGFGVAQAILGVVERALFGGGR